jgi:uncharacterized membrane protein YphA (DoxX/SURF4 family)
MQAPELHGLTGWATIGFARSIVNKLLFETTPFTNASSRGCLDKPARAGRATQIAAMVITGLVAFIWVYFGRLYLIHDPDEWRIANQQLGYPLYIIPLIGVTHILGGVGLLIPNMPRLTEWVYAGLAINLLLAFYSQLNGGGSTSDKFDPILVMAFVFASYVLRRCMRANRWSIRRTRSAGSFTFSRHVAEAQRGSGPRPFASETSRKMRLRDACEFPNYLGEFFLRCLRHALDGYQ